MKLSFLNDEEFIFFKTRDYALLNDLSISAATGQLGRFAAQGLIVRLTRGVWANPKHPFFNPLGAVPYLLNNNQGYISFLTALSRHGILSQIPQRVQVATTGRSHVLDTPIACYEFIQLSPEMFSSGIEWQDDKSKFGYSMASPEKALLDTLYISTRKGNRFKALPELDLNDNFDKCKFEELLNTNVSNKRIRSAIVQAEKTLDNL